MPNPFQLELLPLLRKPGDAPPPQRRHLLVGARIIEYRLIRAARRRLGMSIDQRGLRVSASLGTPLRDIERFVQSNDRWVLKKLEEWRCHDAPPSITIQDGALIPVRGADCRVRVQAGARQIRWQDGALVVQAPPGSDLQGLARRALRDQALPLFRERVRHFSAMLRLEPPPLALSNAQTRWGSCSRSHGIRLSWRLIHAPPPLIDYVVAHEVAHLIEMNHSPRFWKVVERLCPDYREIRAQLRAFAIRCPQI